MAILSSPLLLLLLLLVLLIAGLVPSDVQGHALTDGSDGPLSTASSPPTPPSGDERSEAKDASPSQLPPASTADATTSSGHSGAPTTHAAATSAVSTSVAKDAMSPATCSAIQGLRGDLELLGHFLVNASKEEELAIVRSLTTPLHNVEAKVDKFAYSSSDHFTRLENKLDSAVQLHTNVGSAVITSSSALMGTLHRLSTDFTKSFEDLKRQLSTANRLINSSSSLQMARLQETVRGVQELLPEKLNQFHGYMEDALARRTGELINLSQNVEVIVEAVAANLRGYISTEVEQLKRDMMSSVNERLERSESATSARLQSLEDFLNTSLSSVRDDVAEARQDTEEIHARLSTQVANMASEVDERLARSTSTTSDRLQSLEQRLHSSVRSLREDAAEASRGVEEVSSRLGGLASRLENATKVGNVLEEGASRVAGDVRQLQGKVDTALAAVRNLPQVLDSKIASQASQVSRAVSKSREDILRTLHWVGSLRMRLVGPSGSEGRLEVYHAGQWGTVCDDFFNNTTAAAACRYLGLASANAVAYGSAKYGQGSDPIWLDDVICPSSTSLTQCSHRGWGVNNCHHGEDVGVKCA